MKALKWIGIAFVALVVLGAMFGGKPDKAVAKDEQAAAAPAPAAAAPAEDSPAASDLTAPQRNAVRTAKQYLSMQGFSRKGLIRQLSSDAGDGYNVADATAAVDSLNVDWNLEAEKSAKQYLSMQGFSCKGLIQQLSSSAGEGYTSSQARHGATQAGAC